MLGFLGEKLDEGRRMAIMFDRANIVRKSHNLEAS